MRRKRSVTVHGTVSKNHQHLASLAVHNTMMMMMMSSESSPMMSNKGSHNNSNSSSSGSIGSGGSSSRAYNHSLHQQQHQQHNHSHGHHSHGNHQHQQSHQSSPHQQNYQRYHHHHQQHHHHSAVHISTSTTTASHTAPTALHSLHDHFIVSPSSSPVSPSPLSSLQQSPPLFSSSPTLSPPVSSDDAHPTLQSSSPSSSLSLPPPPPTPHIVKLKSTHNNINNNNNNHNNSSTNYYNSSHKLLSTIHDMTSSFNDFGRSSGGTRNRAKSFSGKHTPPPLQQQHSNSNVHSPTTTITSKQLKDMVKIPGVPRMILPREDVHNMEKIFEIFDTDDDGLLSVSDLYIILRKFERNITEYSVRDTIKELSQTDPSTITFYEFVRFLASADPSNVFNDGGSSGGATGCTDVNSTPTTTANSTTTTTTTTTCTTPTTPTTSTLTTTTTTTTAAAATITRKRSLRIDTSSPSTQLRHSSSYNNNGTAHSPSSSGTTKKGSRIRLMNQNSMSSSAGGAQSPTISLPSIQSRRNCSSPSGSNSPPTPTSRKGSFVSRVPSLRSPSSLKTAPPLSPSLLPLSPDEPPSFTAIDVESEGSCSSSDEEDEVEDEDDHDHDSEDVDVDDDDGDKQYKDRSDVRFGGYRSTTPVPNNHGVDTASTSPSYDERHSQPLPSYTSYTETMIEQKKRYMHDAFKAFDVGGKGRIGTKEIKTVFSKLGLSSILSDHEVRSLLASVDGDNDGKIDFQEFCTLVDL